MNNGEEQQEYMVEEYIEDQSQPRALPMNIKAEAGLLGCILLDYQRVLDICFYKGLNSRDVFYPTQHKLVFQAIINLYNKKQSIDLVTIGEYLQSKQKLVKIGGFEFLEELIMKTPTTAHAEYYIGLVLDAYMRRNIITSSTDVIESCYDADMKSVDVLAKAEQSFMGLASNVVEKTRSWKDTVAISMEELNKLIAGDKTANGIPTGFADLDRQLLGLKKSEMIVVAATPSMGKTSLAMNIAENIALGNVSDFLPRSVGMFSLEMSNDSLAKRMICCHAEVSSYGLSQGYGVSDAIKKRLADSTEILSNADIHVDDVGGLDVMDMRSRARRMKKKHDVQLIIIDYLQLLNCKTHGRFGRQLETVAISGHIKAMAKELGVPVVVLSQLSRKVNERPDKIPIMSDLRDSGAIEQDADIICMLRRPHKNGERRYEEFPNLSIVDVLKNRNGSCGEVFLNFEDSFTKFSDRRIDYDDNIK